VGMRKQDKRELVRPVGTNAPISLLEVFVPLE